MIDIKRDISSVKILNSLSGNVPFTSNGVRLASQNLKDNLSNSKGGKDQVDRDLSNKKKCRHIIKEKEARKFIKQLKKVNTNKDIFDKYTIVKVLFKRSFSLSENENKLRNGPKNEDFGNIYICKDIHDESYVMKVLPKTACSFKEMYIHVYLQSDYVVPIHDIYINDDKIYIIMEYIPGGDLFEQVDSMDLTYNDSLSIVYRISTLLKYIHSNGVIHGDLKMENILIDKLNMYICDFGFSVFADSSYTPSIFYTNPYTAPEQLRYRNFTYKSDVWSLGVILYTLCFNSYPFGYDNDQEYTPYEMYMLIINKPLGIPVNTPKRIAKLISGMLEIDPKNRYSLKKVRQYLLSM